MTAMQDQATPQRHDIYVVTRTSNGNGVFLNFVGVRIELNLTAMALWDLCDGTTTVEEMTRAVSALFDLPFERARNEVVEALVSMAAVGLVR